ncbi:superinfection immunity protein [Candidatus Woesearchaeota archaeon]|jgi:hypothetical protein|nr:superinfection immunity protein [Candidatus Woesearchaeota archaeon]
MNNSSDIGVLILLPIVLLLYFLPSLIASKRKHLNATSITLTNFLLGWTFLGWVIALIWSFSNNRADQQKLDKKIPNSLNPNKYCSNCGDNAGISDKYCGSCGESFD